MQAPKYIGPFRISCVASPGSPNQLKLPKGLKAREISLLRRHFQTTMPSPLDSSCIKYRALGRSGVLIGYSRILAESVMHCSRCNGRRTVCGVACISCPGQDGSDSMKELGVGRLASRRRGSAQVIEYKHGPFVGMASATSIYSKIKGSKNFIPSRMPCQESRSHPRPRYPDRAGPYRAPSAHAGDSHIVLSHQEFDFIIEQQERMISLMNMLVQQNSRPNITPVVQTLPRHVRSSLAGQANAGGRSSLDRVGGLMPPTGPRGRGQTTVRGRRHFRNQNRRDRRVRDGQGMEAAQAPAGEGRCHRW